jgi:hypothetical protein
MSGPPPLFGTQIPVFLFFQRLTVAEPAHWEKGPEVLEVTGHFLEAAIHLEYRDSLVLTCNSS